MTGLHGASNLGSDAECEPCVLAHRCQISLISLILTSVQIPAANIQKNLTGPGDWRCCSRLTPVILERERELHTGVMLGVHTPQCTVRIWPYLTEIPLWIDAPFTKSPTLLPLAPTTFLYPLSLLSPLLLIPVLSISPTLFFLSLYLSLSLLISLSYPSPICGKLRLCACRR